MIRAALALSLAALALLTTRDAAACTILNHPLRVFATPAAHYPVPTDGVVAVAVHYDPGEVLDDLAGVIVTLDAGGAPLDVELALHDIGGEPVPGVMRDRPAILVVRPLVPLAPLAAHHLVIDAGELGGDVFELDFESGAGPRPSPTPFADEAALGTGDPEVLDRACCEHSLSSCGGSYDCVPTELRHRPAARLGATIRSEDQLHALPWVSRVDAGGHPIDRRYPDPEFWWTAALIDDVDDLWTFAGDAFRLEAGDGRRCFVAGLTDLVSGDERLGEPFCVDTDRDPLPAPELETRDPPEPDPSDPRGCIGPWISERDGAAVEGAGCRVVGAPAPLPALALLALLALTRRRESRAGAPASR